MTQLIEKVERLHNQMKLLHDDQIARRSVWWTLSLVAIVGATIANIALAILNFL